MSKKIEVFIEEKEEVLINVDPVSVSKDHNTLNNRDLAEQHPISAITNLQSTLDTQSSAIAINTSKRTYPIIDEQKLETIESNAQVNTVNKVNEKTGDIVLVKGDIGLGNVDNTSDINKPISTLTQEALNDITKNTTIKSTDTVTADLNNYTEVGSYIVYQSEYGVSNSPTTFSFVMDIVYSPQGGEDAPYCGRMQIAYVGAGDVYRNIYIRKTSDGVSYADWGGVNTIDWDEDNEYRTNDICFYQGVIYKSLSSGNKGNVPVDNLGTKWELYGVKSINGMTGDVVLTTNNIAEESNLYFTQDRVTNNSSVLQNTAKVGITTQQASDILANNDKRSFTQADDDRLANTSNTNTGDQDISGKADLVDGKVPASQLPASVDEIIEEPTFADFPAVGETNKIYLALDTNKTYRWGGTQYVAVNESLALGDTSSTAYRGDRGAIAFNHSQEKTGNPHNVTKTDVGLGNVEDGAEINTINQIDAGTGVTVVKNGTTVTISADGSQEDINIQGTFTESDLVDGILTIVHTYQNLVMPYVILDSSKAVVIPDNLTYGYNLITIDLSTQQPITGTWEYNFSATCRIVKGVINIEDIVRVDGYISTLDIDKTNKTVVRNSDGMATGLENT